jgi:hypothetical protein
MTEPLTKFACPACRKSFKRPAGHAGKRNLPRPIERRPCPHCGGDAYLMGSNFRAPPARDIEAWRVVEFLIKAGLPYFDIGQAYPTDLPEAVRFAEANRDSAQPIL